MDPKSVVHSGMTKGVKSCVLLNAVTRHLLPSAALLLDLGSQAQTDLEPLSRTDLEGKTISLLCPVPTLCLYCSGWRLVHGLFFRSRQLDHSQFYHHGTKYSHLQCFKRKGIEPGEFHVYRITGVLIRLQLSHQDHLTQCGCSQAGASPGLAVYRRSQIRSLSSELLRERRLEFCLRQTAWMIG